MEVTVLFERDSYAIDSSGRATYRHSMIFRIETQPGVEDWAETSERWNPWYQKKPEIRARVIRPDGKVSQLDPKTVTDGPAKDDDEDLTYSDARLRKAPLPGLAVGAIVEEETVREDKAPFFAGGGVYRTYFSRDVPVIHSELNIDIAKELKLRFSAHLLPGLVTKDEELDGVRHVAFIQGYLAARQASDIKLSTPLLYTPMVEFSTGESWASVADFYRKLAEPQIDPAKVKSYLPAETSNVRIDTIQRVVARLHKEIRYTGIEFGEASLQPQPAAEVFKRHFGDCKDKAALLVGLLRAAGIPANLALLDTGPGLDVTPELPGMNQFDHAIVYVPADGKGGDALWIDATAEYSQVGNLPAMDRGRLALIIAEGTSALTQTPAATPEDDVLIEERNVVMAENGSAHITETSLTQGEVDDSYRSDYGGAETRKQKTDLETYVKGQYLATALTSVEHGEGKDLTKPFRLKLDMAHAKRGNTDIDDAAVAIPFSGLFYRLPSWFRTDPRPNGEKLTPQQEEDQKKAVLARVSEYDVHPFTTEWRYTITPPEGFSLRALPENKTTEMGPARFTQHYEADPKGVITAVLRFSTIKPRYTVDEVVALRDAVLAAYKQDMIMVLFDQTGSKLLAAGKIREALNTDRALIERHPTEALHHAQIAYALLQAGMGDRARAEAEQATKLDPKSAVAFKALGWVCQFNAIGVRHARGFDWDCASAAYKKAVDLDLEDSYTPVNLAILDEFDHQGERYSKDANLKEALAEYKVATERDKSVGDSYQDNQLLDLLYSGQYKELLQELAKLPSSATRDGLSITAAVALEGGAKGIAAGIDRADHLPKGAQERNAALATAGSQLLQLRLYPEAVGLLSASVEGQSNSAGVTQQISVFRNVTPWKKDYLPTSDPRSAVQRMVLTLMVGGYTDSVLAEILSRHAYGTDVEWKKNSEKIMQGQGMLQAIAARSGMPARVLMDVIASNMKLSAEGDDEKGYRVSMQSLGSQTEQTFVSKDDGVYKIVTDGKTPSEAGNEVLYLLRSGRDVEARSLLDWMRDRTHRGGGDDPLSGPLFPRFWTTGTSSGPAAMQLAATALLSGNPQVKELLPSVEVQLQKETSEESRTSLALLLANGYIATQNGEGARKATELLLESNPDSNTALSLVGGAAVLNKTLSDWDALIDIQLKKHPQDETLLRMKVKAAEWQGKFDAARAAQQKVIDSGKATAGDYNGYAWLGLFDGKVDAEGVKAAQQASMLSKKASFAELHTLACVYAYQGKTSEARELLLQAMATVNLSEPNSEVWYGFGSIYEYYGVNEAAIAAYRKVEKPEGVISPTSTYLLAQTHLKSLGAL